MIFAQIAFITSVVLLGGVLVLALVFGPSFPVKRPPSPPYPYPRWRKFGVPTLSIHVTFPDVDLTERRREALVSFAKQHAREMQAHCGLAFADNIPEVFVVYRDPMGEEHELKLTHAPPPVLPTE